MGNELHLFQTLLQTWENSGRLEEASERIRSDVRDNCWSLTSLRTLVLGIGSLHGHLEAFLVVAELCLGQLVAACPSPPTWVLEAISSKMEVDRVAFSSVCMTTHSHHAFLVGSLSSNMREPISTAKQLMEHLKQSVACSPSCETKLVPLVRALHAIHRQIATLPTPAPSLLTDLTLLDSNLIDPSLMESVLRANWLELAKAVLDYLPFLPIRNMRPTYRILLLAYTSAWRIQFHPGTYYQRKQMYVQTLRSMRNLSSLEKTGVVKATNLIESLTVATDPTPFLVDLLETLYYPANLLFIV